MAYTIKDAGGNTVYMDGAGTGADSGNAITPNSTILGAINETAPASDTASAGLNGRLQRIAQLLSALIALKKSVTATLSNVASSATNVTVIASNSSRIGATVYNDSAAYLYLKLGTTASATSFTIKIDPSGYYEVPFGYTGIIDGLWASANGSARVTELT